jgi:hypothetical protein
MDHPGEPSRETFNPWSIVNVVFHHLAEQGLHPTLGDAGDPGAPAADLLRCLGIQPAAEGNLHIAQDVRQQLADLRTAFFGDT